MPRAGCAGTPRRPQASGNSPVWSSTSRTTVSVPGWPRRRAAGTGRKHSFVVSMKIRYFSSTAATCSRLPGADCCWTIHRSEEHTSELQSFRRISYAVFCLKKKKQKNRNNQQKTKKKKKQKTNAHTTY